MKLSFKVNPYYLLFHSLEKAWNNQPFSEWSKLAKKVKSSKWFIFKNRGITFSQINNHEQLKYTFLKTESNLLKIFKTRAFKRLLQETENYRDWVEQIWNKNKDIVLELLEEITGLKLPDILIKVFITHPALSNGFNIPEEKIIFWGHSEDWKNYTLVYLCHEILHIVLYKKYKNDLLIHSLIELATDNELRIRLNQRGKYFKENKQEIGHRQLRALEKQILPIWKKYLNKEIRCRNILKLEKIILKNNALIMKYDQGILKSVYLE